MIQMGPIGASLIAGLITGLGGGILLTRKIKQQDYKAGKSRSEISADISVVTTVRSTKNVSDGQASKTAAILETRVEVKNNSNNVFSLPAVFVSARALVSSGNEAKYRGTYDFDSLPDCGELTKLVNVAFIPNSLIQVSPGEVERLVRWDTLTEAFIEKYPIIVIAVEAFTAAGDLLGWNTETEWCRAQRVNEVQLKRWEKAIGFTRVNKLNPGVYREPWIDFMQARDSTSVTPIHDYIPFKRWYPSETPMKAPCDKGRRFICLPDGLPDYQRTSEFRQVLDSMMQWTRHVTVDFQELNK